MIACYGNNISEIKKLIQRQVTFLKQYDVLVNLYTLDYFVCNHWSKIPASWQRVLLQLEVQDFGDFLDLNKEFKCKKSPLPLSLLAFRASVSSLSLPRQSENAVKLLDEFLYKAYGFEKSNLEKFQCKEAKDEFLSLSQKCSSQHKDLPKVCRRHVKLKKQHEICHIAQLACLALQKVNVNCVMDIGSGLGHLSRLLSLEYNLKVTTIEAESGHVSLATNLDKKAIMHLQKEFKSKIINSDDAFLVMGNDVSSKELPQHVENIISLSSSHENLQKIIKQAWMEKDGQNLQPFALIGLHTCGDLCAALLRIFLEISEAQILLSVGCCYMKLSTGMCCGFPLSNLVNELSISLSPEAREIACHALEKYVKRLKENADSLKIHCYRAVLENIIVKQDSSMRHLGLKGIKHAEKMKFHEYATKALENVSIEISDIDGLFDDICLKEWKNVVAIYSLRLLIAPVIESLIILDRMVFLHEKGLHSCVIPIFNPSISPRNHLLFSLKYC